MTVKKLNKDQKEVLIRQYESNKVSQRLLATRFGVSTRTVGRVLVEAGLATPVQRIKGEAYQVMQLLKKNGLGLPELKDLLSGQQALAISSQVNEQTVQQYLNSSSEEQLARMFYAAGLVKIAEKHNTMVQTATLRLSEQTRLTAKENMYFLTQPNNESKHS